jgi:D-alanyl-D-alanine carboxypeptidase (penicillin-binding protein 5/6)
MNFLIRKKVHITIGLSVAAIIIAALAVSISRKAYVVAPFPAQTSTSTDPFAGLVLEAKAAYVLDLSTGKALFVKDESEVLPLASITKLVSAYVAGRSLPSQTSISITRGDSNGLDPGETWSLQNLLDFTLVTSSNDGINAIASVAGSVLATSTAKDPQSVFVDEMNESMKRLGLADMRFYNPSGLDLSATTSGGYGSAKDVATLILHILKEDSSLLAATPAQTIKISSNLVNHIATNTDEALRDIPAPIVSKTGNTNLAGGNLAVLFDAGLMHPVEIVVLGSSYDGRFTDMESLVSAVMKKISQ